MLPKTHIIINLFISLPLLFILKPIYVLIFFFSSILIDVDHYIYYVFKKKDLSLKRAYKWFLVGRAKWLKMSQEERKKHKHGFMVFHGIEPLFLVLVLSFFYQPLFFVFLGFSIHMVEDLIEAIPLQTAKTKLFLSYSIYNYFKKK